MNFQTIFLGVLVVVSIPLWIRFLRSISRGQPGLERRPRIQSPIGLADVGILLLVTAGTEIILGSLANGWFARPDRIAGMEEQPIIHLILFAAIGKLFGVFAGVWAITLRHGQGFAIFGWQPQNFSRDLLIGIASFSMVVPIVLLVHQFLSALIKYEHPTMTMLEGSSDSFSILVLWFSAVLVAPVQEEIFYRGTLLSWLQRFPPTTNEAFSKVLGGGWVELPGQESGTGKDYQPQQVESDSTLRWPPIFISAVIFGAVHMNQGAAPISLFLFAVALGYIYRQTGSIVPCIVLHMLLNGMTMMFLTFEKMFGS